MAPTYTAAKVLARLELLESYARAEHLNEDDVLDPEETVRFESQDAMRFGPRSYTGEQQEVIDAAVASRKPLTAPSLPDPEEATNA